MASAATPAAVSPPTSPLSLPQNHHGPTHQMQQPQSPTTMLDEILTTPLNPDELEFEVDDPGFVRNFEKAWMRFLKDNPEMIPRGKREEKVRALQDEARETEEAKLKVLKEMEQQIEFFKASCEALEDVYAGKMQTAIEKQRHVQDDLQNRLNDVAIADQLQQQTLPWHHFIHEVEQAAQDAGDDLWDNISHSIDGNGSIVSSRNTARPSIHAQILTDRTKGSASDILLRSYRIDHELLTAHIRILSKEVERYERVVRAQEMTGKFLREYNAWAILNKEEEGSSSSTSSSASADGAGGRGASSSSGAEGVSTGGDGGGITSNSGVTSSSDSCIP